MDTDSGKLGSSIENMPVISPDELNKAPSPPFVVVATSYASQVTEHLRGLGYVKDFDYCVARFQ